MKTQAHTETDISGNLSCLGLLSFRLWQAKERLSSIHDPATHGELDRYIASLQKEIALEIAAIESKAPKHWLEAPHTQ